MYRSVGWIVGAVIAANEPPLVLTAGRRKRLVIACSR